MIPPQTLQCLTQTCATIGCSSILQLINNSQKDLQHTANSYLLGEDVLFVLELPVRWTTTSLFVSRPEEIIACGLEETT